MNITIHCKKEWSEARELSISNRDETFGKCMFRLMTYASLETVHQVNIYKDYDKHCFYFTMLREDGSLYMNGGVIFHGFPELGYKQNGSVQLNPSYGWSIHT